MGGRSDRAARQERVKTGDPEIAFNTWAARVRKLPMFCAAANRKRE